MRTARHLSCPRPKHFARGRRPAGQVVKVYYHVGAYLECIGRLCLDCGALWNDNLPNIPLRVQRDGTGGP